MNDPESGHGSSPSGRHNLFGLTREQIAEAVRPILDHPYRVGQIYCALYERQASSFGEITELSKAFRRRLDERFCLDRPEIAARHRSADGTVKYLFRLSDGATIEAVDIPDRKRRTLCLSSQAGCALGCRFCVTGFWGGGRNLSAGEIISQVFQLRARPVPDSPTRAAASEGLQGVNLVFMGMGEPLLNMDGLGAALEILLDQISWRRVTVSTAGIVPGIEEVARWPRRPRLAVSLHAPDDDRRSALMPINLRYPLRDLLAVLARFPLAPKERLTFEYILIAGFNDAVEDADALAVLLRGLRAKVNLIPLNPDPVLAGMQPPTTEDVETFRRRLQDRGLLATVRRRRGDDVSAACGQLRAPGREPRGFRRSNLSL